MIISHVRSYGELTLAFLAWAFSKVCRYHTYKLSVQHINLLTHIIIRNERKENSPIKNQSCLSNKAWEQGMDCFVDKTMIPCTCIPHQTDIILSLSEAKKLTISNDEWNDFSQGWRQFAFASLDFVIESLARYYWLILLWALYRPCLNFNFLAAKSVRIRRRWAQSLHLCSKKGVRARI